MKKKYFDLIEVKRAYEKGRNITELLRGQKNISNNSPEIIEVAYDLQAGSYIQYTLDNLDQSLAYASELACILEKHTNKNDTFLDVGTGELTTLSLVISKIDSVPKKIFAFDISWSRLYKGLDFAKHRIGDRFYNIIPFSASMSEISLPDKSIDITTSSHALEPNGGNLDEILKELFRVTSRKLILFEPCYELNSKAGRKRMDALGYIKNIESEVNKLGGKLLEKIKIKNAVNPLNPTYCFVIEPEQVGKDAFYNGESYMFSEPVTNYPLKKIDNFYFSKKTGLCYPIIKSIPVLKSNAAILVSALL
jgi:ubiquinone/menaquinone biosynthesis C-methylase UbiE